MGGACDFYAQNVRALLVDDNPVNLMLAEGVLRRHGLSVVTALSGEEGICKARTEAFDIIFMDYLMPGMNGTEAAAAIRAMGGRYESIPIVAFSSNGDAAARERYHRAGMNAFLRKPIVVRQLHHILTQLLPPGRLMPEGGARQRDKPAR